MDERRILVYGVCGSGKTTFARMLSERSGIPWTSVDDLTWEPGWVEVPLEDQIRKVREVVDRDEWILDTAYGKWRDIPLARVELIIGLDYARHVSFLRLVRRTLSRIVDRKPICNGNLESWRLVLSRDSILLWHLRSWAGKRARIREWQSNPSGPRVIAFRKPAEAEAWLRQVSGATSQDRAPQPAPQPVRASETP